MLKADVLFRNLKSLRLTDLAGCEVPIATRAADMHTTAIDSVVSHDTVFRNLLG